MPQAPVASPATPRDAAANALADLTALTDATGQVPFADDGSDVLDYVREALQDDRIELFLRPIVSLPSRRLAYQECVVGFRAPDGTLLSHDDFMPLAEEAGLAGTVYNLLLVRSVQFVRRMRRLKSQLGYFCPIDPQTLRDPDFLADFVDFMRENTDLAGHLIFELTQYDVYRLDMRTERELAALAKSGFRFCLSETTNLDLFVSDLSDRGFRYVKCDPRTLMGKMVGQADPRAVKKELDRGAMDLIVTGIEDEDTLLSLLDYAIDFGEGPLFGDPHPANRKEA